MSRDAEGRGRAFAVTQTFQVGIGYLGAIAPAASVFSGREKTADLLRMP